MSKAQGMPLNTIVIAAIALIVMVIIIMIFTGRIGNFNSGIDDCASKGGEPSSDGTCDLGSVKIPMKKEGEYCCVPLSDNK